MNKLLQIFMQSPVFALLVAILIFLFLLVFQPEPSTKSVLMWGIRICIIWGATGIFMIWLLGKFSDKKK